MIWEEFKTNLIFIDLDAKDSKEVFEQVGGAFIREGYAKETYIQGLIDREAEFPTGLDIDGFGVAIPHTPVEHVNKTGTAIAVLRNPVTFHEMGGDDEDTVEARLIILSISSAVRCRFPEDPGMRWTRVCRSQKSLISRPR